jgi:hypothetical protein
MSNYRRAFVSGGCWFFTVNLLDRRQTLLVDHIEIPGVCRARGANRSLEGAKYSRPAEYRFSPKLTRQFGKALLQPELDGWPFAIKY